MKNKRRIIGIVAAAILAIIGTMSLVGYVQSARDEAVAQETLVDVYVVDRLVPKGAEAATITSSVSVERVPARLKQSGAITNLDAVGDNVAATDLQPGDQLLAARLIPRDEVAEVVTDKVQISVLLEAQRAVGGSLQEGDLVGVYLSFDPFDLDDDGQITEVTDTNEATDTTNTADTSDPAALAGAAEVTPPTTGAPRRSPNVSRLEFQHVMVTNVQTTDTPVTLDDETTTGLAQVTGKQYVVTLALSPEQSERFVFATEFGHVWLSLDPAAVADDGTRPVTLGNVYSVVN